MEVTDENKKNTYIIDLFHNSADKIDDTIIAPAAMEEEFTFWQ